MRTLSVGAQIRKRKAVNIGAIAECRAIHKSQTPPLVYSITNGFEVKVHVQVPDWLATVIQGERWVSDSNALCQVNIKMNNFRTGTETFTELQHALEARQQILQIREVIKPKTHPVAMQLLWLLKHSNLQNAPGQGQTAHTVFKQLHAASREANVDSATDLVHWAQSYKADVEHQEVVYRNVPWSLSTQIIQWDLNLKQTATVPFDHSNELQEASQQTLPITDSMAQPLSCNSKPPPHQSAALHIFTSGQNGSSLPARPASWDDVAHESQTASNEVYSVAGSPPLVQPEDLAVQNGHVECARTPLTGIQSGVTPAMHTSRSRNQQGFGNPAELLPGAYEWSTASAGTYETEPQNVALACAKVAIAEGADSFSRIDLDPLLERDDAVNEFDLTESPEQMSMPPDQTASFFNSSAGLSSPDSQQRFAQFEQVLASIKDKLDREGHLDYAELGKLGKELQAYAQDAAPGAYAGDQAYWSPRSDGTPGMQTGAIALLRGGKLHAITADSPYHFCDGDQFTVVSNEFAKWKGGYRPENPEEKTGHWCAAIGHVPVWVKGAIGCNQLITASLTDPPMGQSLADVTDPLARQRVVAFALEAKETQAPGKVKAFVLFAFPAIAQLMQVGMGSVHSQLDTLTADLRSLQLASTKYAKNDQEKSSMAALSPHEAEPRSSSKHAATWQQCCLLSPLGPTFGLDTQLTDLEGWIQGKTNTVIAICGSAGMGKTTLATALGRRLWDSEQVDCACCADLRGANTADLALCQVGHAVQKISEKPVAPLPMQAEPQDAAAMLNRVCCMLKALAGPPRLCLIIDNAEDVFDAVGQAQTFEDGISKLLTACPAMSIIIASRTSDMFVGSSISVSSLHMKPLAVADAQSLVEHFAQHTPHAVAAQLAEMCENTPIALSVVSKAIGDSPSLGKDMVDILKSQGLVQGLTSTSRAGGERLQLCVSSSLLQLPASDRTALAILTIFPNTFDVEAAAAVLNTGSTEALACLARLQLRSWVTVTDERQGQRTQRSYQLHLLIRDIAAAGYVTSPVYTHAQEAFIQHYLAMLHTAAPQYTPAGLDAMVQIRLQRHNLSKALVQLAMQDKPVAQLSRHCHMGLYALLALTSSSFDSETVARAMHQLLAWAQAGSSAAVVAEAKEQLGFVLAQMPGHEHEAEQMLTAALNARVAACGPEHPGLAVSLRGLARLMYTKACSRNLDDEESEVAEQQAAAYRQQLYQMLCKTKGEAHPETICWAVHIAGFIEVDAERIQALQELLDLAEEELDAAHHIVVALKFEISRLRARSGYAGVRSSISDLRDHLQSLSQQRGAHDASLVEPLTCLGKALIHSHDASEQQEGLQCLQRAVAAQVAQHGNAHKEVLLMQLDDLLPSLIVLQQADDALQLSNELQPICEQVFGRSSMEMVDIVKCMASAYEIKDDHVAAETKWRGALSMAKVMKQDANASEQYAFAVKEGIVLDLAFNLELQGRYEEAGRLHKKALKALQITSRSNFSLRADHKVSMAALLRRQADFAATATLLQEAVVDYGKDEEWVCDALMESARLAKDMGDVDGALQSMEALQAQLYKCNSNSKNRAFELCEELAWAHFQRHNWDIALSYFEKALTLTERMTIGNYKPHLEAAVVYAGAAAVHLQRDRFSSQGADYLARAEHHLDCCAFRNVDGVQRAYFYLGVCKQLQEQPHAAGVHFSQALQTQLAIYAADHPACAAFEVCCDRSCVEHKLAKGPTVVTL